MNAKQLYGLYGMRLYRVCRTCGNKKYGMAMSSINFNGNQIVSEQSKCCRKPDYYWDDVFTDNKE